MNSTIRRAHVAPAIFRAVAACAFLGLAVTAPAEVERYLEFLAHHGGDRSLGTVADGRLYSVANGRFEIHDLADPANPALLGSLEVGAAMRGGTIQGKRAFSISRQFPNELAVIDITSPEAPTLLARVPLPAPPAAVAVTDNLVAVALFTARLAVIDITDLQNPVVHRPAVSMTYISSVAFDGEGRLIAGGNLSGGLGSPNGGGFRALRLSGGGAQAVTETWASITGSPMLTVNRVEGSTLYATRNERTTQPPAVLVYDLSAPSQTTPTQTIALPARSAGFKWLDDSHLLATMQDEVGVLSNRLIILDISDPGNVQQVFEETIAGGIGGSAVGDGLAFVGSANSGSWFTYDVSTPSATTRLARHDAIGSPVYLQYNGTRAYSVSYFAGIQLYDVADPAAPALLHTLDLPGSTVHASNSGSLVAATAIDRDFVTFIDVWNLSGPQILATVPIGFHGYTTAISGSRLYVGEVGVIGSDEGRRVAAIDISNLASPVQLGEFEAALPSPSLDVRGTTLFLTAYGYTQEGPTGAFQVVDFSQPATPQLIHESRFPGQVYGFLHGDLFVQGVSLVPGSNSYVTIHDVLQPDSPQLLARIDLPAADPVLIDVRGDTLAVLSIASPPDSGIVSTVRTYNITDPTRPQPWGRIDHEGLLAGVSLTDTHFFGGFFGLSSFALNTPTAAGSSLLAY